MDVNARRQYVQLLFARLLRSIVRLHLRCSLFEKLDALSEGQVDWNALKVALDLLGLDG
jgi:hypothetical protein